MVDNEIPYADIYADIPYDQQEVEVYLMLDKNLNQTKTNYINNNLVTITNEFRREAIEPVVKKWDMRTYVHTKSVSTSSNSGTSFPSSTYYYYSSDGYSGTLSRYSYSDNGGYRDFGKYENRTESKTATGQSSGWSRVIWDADGNELYKGGSSQPTLSYSDSEGYSGTLSQTDHTNDGCETTTLSDGGKDRYCTFTGYYSGTVTRTVQVWVEDIRWVSDYTGYYSGTVSKDVRELYSTPWQSTTSSKYIVYISDTTISEIADFTNARNKADASVLLVGSSAIRNQTSYDKYIVNTGQSIESIIESVVKEIAALNPPRPSMTVLINQMFQMQTFDTDPENDPIVQPQTQYVHDPNYYDNPQGRSGYAYASFNVNQYQSQTLRTSFDKPGLYTVYRRTKDSPVGKPAYSYYSNEAFMTIAVHRKPIAQAVLDWDYNPSTGLYATSWVDQSYDLDHQHSDAERGIRERKIRFRETGGEWLYYIPDELDSGSYELEYTVRDIEGVWSDPFRLTFTLANVPPPQLDAKARTERSKFTLTNVPASEQLRLYEIWTRYPYSHSLEVAIYNAAGTTRMTNTRSVAYNNGNKSGNDVFWNDIVYTIPDTLPDGNYVLRISAIGQNGIRTNKDFPIRVNTPINLVPELESSLLTRETTDIKASTTKYANSVTVTMFRGSSYQVDQVLTGTHSGDIKNWMKSYLVPSIPDGQYQVRYVARTPNGKSQTVDLTVQVINNRPPVANFTWSPTTIWEGDTVRFTNLSTDPDGDALTYSWVIREPNGSEYRYSQQHVNRTLTQTGVHTVQLTVSDGRATAQKIASLDVRELTLTADVRHTEHWRDYHREAGHEIDENPKDFYSGETFLLLASTSPAPVRSISATLNATSRSGEPLEASTDLHAVGSSRYEGTLYDARFSSLAEGIADGEYTIRFHITYTNGTQKMADVPIRIIGHVLETVGVHRRR